MNKSLILLSVLALTGTILYFGLENQIETKTVPASEFSSQFNSFRSKFGKIYSSENDAKYRQAIFNKNLEMINNHNSDSSSTYQLGINQFSDLTFEEFSSFYLKPLAPELIIPEPSPELYFAPVSFEDNELDWRTKGIINKVKNQARCGSCWAFSAVAAVEQAYSLFKGEKVIDLAEQELVDCSRSYGNQGCNGGWEDKGIAYIKDKGISDQVDYPYVARDQTCKKTNTGKHKVASVNFVPAGPAPYVARLRIQPTTAAFHVQNDFFQYKSGVYNPKSCPKQANHAVNSIGFKVDGATPYFLVRNSWGTAWGDQGFFKIAIATGSGICGFSDQKNTAYPSF